MFEKTGLSILMFWYEHGSTIDKYRWLFYAGVFVGIFISLIIVLIFHEKHIPEIRYINPGQPQEQAPKRGSAFIPCTERVRDLERSYLDGRDKKSSII